MRRAPVAVPPSRRTTRGAVWCVAAAALAHLGAGWLPASAASAEARPLSHASRTRRSWSRIRASRASIFVRCLARHRSPFSLWWESSHAQATATSPDAT